MTSQHFFYFLLTFQGAISKQMFQDIATLLLPSSFA